MASNAEYTCELGKDNVLLQEIVEADETYIGGKSRPDYDHEDGDVEPLKRGRGTSKDAVLEAIARGGKVVAQLTKNVKAETITEFIKKFVDTDKTEFIRISLERITMLAKLCRSMKQ